MTSRPMQFPKPGRLLLWLVLAFFLAPAIATPFLMWAWWRLDPVQSFYFVPYRESAMEGDTKGGSVTVQYATKTALERQLALHGCVQILYKPAHTLLTERRRNRGGEAEQRTMPDGVCNNCDVVELGVGITVATTCLVLAPPNKPRNERVKAWVSTLPPGPLRPLLPC